MTVHINISVDKKRKISEIIRNTRKQANIRLLDMAKLVNLSSSALSNIERGYSFPPTIEKLREICRSYKISKPNLEEIKNLLGRVEESLSPVEIETAGFSRQKSIKESFKEVLLAETKALIDLATEEQLLKILYHLKR